MKKMLLGLLVGISLIGMAGCTNNEMKSHVENNTTIAEENDYTKLDYGDKFILEQRGFDEYVIKQYSNGDISLQSFKQHFSYEPAYVFYNYTEFTSIFSNSNQKAFCEDYIDFCEGMINYYPQDEPISDVVDKLSKVYDDHGYTSDKTIKWRENK